MSSRTGAERSDVDPIWPTRLVAPPADVQLIYLDLNHWIGLSKAAVRHKDGVDLSVVLEKLRALKSRCIYVIGMPLIMEITGNLRRSQRNDLCNIIEEFTDFACVMPSTAIAALEFESALAAVASVTEHFAPMPLLGRGVLQACGMSGGLKVYDKEGDDVTEAARRDFQAGPEAFDRLLADGARQFDRLVMRGPQDDAQERDLRARGWDPSGAHAVAETRAQQEREQADRLTANPEWRRGRLRDIIGARYLTVDIESTREAALDLHGIRLRDILTTPEHARRFVDSMPSADVRLTLITAKHRSIDSQWEPNDIFDVDALSVAAAYCDVVVTERHSAHVLRQAGVPQRLKTVVLTKLGELANHLARSDSQ